MNDWFRVTQIDFEVDGDNQEFLTYMLSEHSGIRWVEVLAQSTNPIAAHESVASIDRRLDSRHPNLQIEGSNLVTDGDGAIWIDNDDHSIHYVVNGNEYKLTGTLV